jgi:hypothetical protein
MAQETPNEEERRLEARLSDLLSAMRDEFLQSEVIKLTQDLHG